MKIPKRAAELLATKQELSGLVNLNCFKFGEWLKQNKVVFFPEYTDHSLTHIEKVLETACSLPSDLAWEILSAADIAVLTLATLIHDSGMHLTVDGFADLIRTDSARPLVPFANDVPWATLWQDFL